TDLFKVDRFVMQDGLILVQMFDEFGNAAAIIKLVRFLCLFTLVLDRDPNAFVKKSFFAQTLREFIETELNGVKDFCVGPEGNLCSPLFSLASLLERRDRNTALVILFIGEAIAPDFQMHGFRQKVNNRNANAMQ